MDQDLIRNVLTALQIVGGGVFVVIWYNFTQMSSRLRKNEEELSAYKLHVSETYMTYKAMEPLMAKLNRIEDKLDKKQDKA